MSLYVTAVSYRTAAVRSGSWLALAGTLVNFDTFKTALCVYVLLTRSAKAYRHVRARGVVETLQDGYKGLLERMIFLALKFPSAKKQVDDKLAETRQKIDDKIMPKDPSIVRHLALPAEGRTAEWIAQEMERMDKALESGSYKDGKLSGAVYHGGEDMENIIVDAFRKYCVSNPLHPDAFPTVRKMEAEVVAMCLRLYSNPDGAGAMTSGGTESIIMSVKAHRDWAYATKGITEPEIAIPVSAHAAFDKAGDYLKVKVHTIPVDPVTRKVDIKKMKRAINKNTIMIVGSAINFPDGCMDDIPALSELAKKYKTGLHVDCCLGSFIVPFLEQAGYPAPHRFDFSLPGVTSISCDTHKYGFAPKGSSVIMYRNADLRRFQYYVTSKWPGGLYGSPSMAGSRPGALIAGTWAAMQYMGQDGYIESCKSIVTCARTIARAIRQEIPELYVLGDPPASVVAFASKHPRVQALAVGDAMSKKGWHLNGLSGPPAVHIACTRLTVPVVDKFIADLKECVQEVKERPATDKTEGDMVAVYGVGTSSAVGPAMCEKVASMFLDALYRA
ncbi:PLP-dependent transferase [Schizopora paradoxa]|uniref:sphinganine-1-phosphate aldolase n=1 Tax=Schizopora paradoxa TaxID=27342 RepID=A0A0H2RUA7_9AGAM|nr:PLP-dependent transferase [Schizopora paradoxa]